MNKVSRMKLLTATIGALLALPAAAQTLSEAVQETLKTNPDILFTVQERLSIDQELRQARAGYLPSVDLNAGIGRERSDNPTTLASGFDSVTLTRREAGVSLDQLLFDGFATPSEVERQMSRVNSSAWRVYSTTENTALRAVEVYLDVLRRQELVAVAKENLKAHERTYDQIHLRSESGIGRKSDLEQTVGRLALARTNLMSEETNLKDAEANFQRVVGMMPQELGLPEAPTGALPASLDQAIQLALANHPTLKSAEADVAAADAQHKAAKSPFYPRLDLEVGATSNNDLDGVDGKNSDASAMLRLRYNLFSGGRDTARREQTAYLVNAAKEVRDRTHREVVESMQLSWDAWQVAHGQLEYRKQHVEASAQARDAYRKQFDLGERTLLDVLDSENEVFVSRTAWINSRYTEAFAQYRILAGMGKLAESLNVPLPQESTPLSTQ